MIARSFWRRNWSPRGWRYEAADGFVVSIPKSGRTWLRVFLRHYLCHQAGVQFCLKGPLEGNNKLPNIEFSHDHWEHTHATSLVDRFLGKYLITETVRNSSPIVLAVRDLRDMMVSLHFHLEKRGFACGVQFEGSLTELLNHPELGVERSVNLLNCWYEEWRNSGQLFIWRYEDCRLNPVAEFTKLLYFLGIPVTSEEDVTQSVKFSAFDSMQSMERSGSHWQSPILRPGDISDPDSFKVRRGVVGGYRDYLNAEHLEIIPVWNSKRTGYDFRRSRYLSP